MSLISQLYLVFYTILHSFPRCRLIPRSKSPTQINQSTTAHLRSGAQGESPILRGNDFGKDKAFDLGKVIGVVLAASVCLGFLGVAGAKVWQSVFGNYHGAAGSETCNINGAGKLFKLASIIKKLWRDFET